MSVTDGLKPPPKFVTNEWAWAYTLNKLKAKDGLDFYGNPSNYGAAIAIYKRVVGKYGSGLADLPDVQADDYGVRRATLLDTDEAPAWYVSRGLCWSATDEAQQVMSLDTSTREHRDGDSAIIKPYHAIVLTRYMDNQQQVSRLPPETAGWLVRESHAGRSWAYEKFMEALADLATVEEDVEAAKVDCDRDGVEVACIGEHSLQCAFFDFDETLRLIEKRADELSEAQSSLNLR